MEKDNITVTDNDYREHKDYPRAKRMAAGLVSARMYTCREVVDRLVRKKIDIFVAEGVVSEFAAEKLLDDKVYAKFYVEDSVNLGFKGLYRIKQELYAKGVAKSIVDWACKDGEYDTFGSLCKYVEDRNLCSGITTRKELEKLKAKLARRGYSYSEIKECLDNYNIVIED